MLSHKYAKKIISYTFFSEIRLAINSKNKQSPITNQRDSGLTAVGWQKKTVDSLILFSKDKK